MVHAWRNHQGEVVVVAGVCLLLYQSLLVGFYIIYSKQYQNIMAGDRAAAAGGQRMF